MYRPVPLCDISQVVRTGTYYIIVQVGTGRYVPVRTDMYQVYRIPDDSGRARTGLGQGHGAEAWCSAGLIQPLRRLLRRRQARRYIWRRTACS
jgi:hypothetical protein